MSDKAINHNVLLRVKNGKYTLILDFSGLTVGSAKGYLGRLKYFKAGYKVTKNGVPKGKAAAAKIVSYQKKNGKKLTDTYGKNYPKKVSFPMIKQAKKNGYVETLFGRRRYLPELASSNFNMRAFGERVARNMPIQGTAADIIKIAMVHVRNRLKAEKLDAKLILQVHDELIVECPEAESDTVKKILEEEMANAVQLSVPMLAEAGSGKSWYQAKG